MKDARAQCNNMNNISNYSNNKQTHTCYCCHYYYYFFNNYYHHYHHYYQCPGQVRCRAPARGGRPRTRKPVLHLRFIESLLRVGSDGVCITSTVCYTADRVDWICVRLLLARGKARMMMLIMVIVIAIIINKLTFNKQTPNHDNNNNNDNDNNDNNKKQHDDTTNKDTNKQLTTPYPR